MRSLKDKHFEEKVASQKIDDILHALKYMHELEIAHRDIKPENIVMSNVIFYFTTGRMQIVRFWLGCPLRKQKNHSLWHYWLCASISAWRKRVRNNDGFVVYGSALLRVVGGQGSFLQCEQKANNSENHKSGHKRVEDSWPFVKRSHRFYRKHAGKKSRIKNVRLGCHQTLVHCQTCRKRWLKIERPP